MPNALLSGRYAMGRPLPQGHRHFLFVMWRCCHVVATLMGGKQGGDARVLVICEKIEDL